MVVINLTQCCNPKEEGPNFLSQLKSTLCRLQCNARVCLCFDSFGERTLW